MQRIVATDMHVPIHRQRPDQDQAFKVICMFQLRGLQIKAAALAVGECRLDRPARTVIEHRRTCRGALHGDYPRLFMADLVQNPQVGQDPIGEQPHLRHITFFHPPRQCPRGRLLAMTGIGQQIALEP